jgi:hypothetical protein
MTTRSDRETQAFRLFQQREAQTAEAVLEKSRSPKPENTPMLAMLLVSLR